MADVFRLVAAVTQLKSRVQALTAENNQLIQKLSAVPTTENDALKQRSAAEPFELRGVFQVATEEVLSHAAREVYLRSLRHQS